MHIGWNRIWKVLLGCACVIGSIVLLACGQVGWGIAALEAAVLLLALQYAPRAARLRKTWWFVELVLVLAVTVGYAGFAAVIFAVALLFAGISSTITSGMAAGSIFAGIYKEPYDIKDSHSRIGVLTSLILAFALIMVVSNPFQGLIYSQMALSVQLPITIFTQVYLTSSSKVMGKYKNSTYTKWLLYVIGGIVTLLNVMLLISFL